jgi:hypothetical protein
MLVMVLNLRRYQSYTLALVIYVSFNLVTQFFSELCCKEVRYGFGLLVKAGNM